MKIVAFETEEWEQTACLRLRRQHELQCYPQALELANATQAAEAEIVTTFIQSRLDAGVLSQLPQLRLIATRSTGYDHID
ncbi:hypothetical protein ABTN18_19910, partial [Acinetobacter baumannii]